MQNNNDIINFYELDAVKRHNVQYHNPSYDKRTQPLKHPFRMLIVGPSGSGKTNSVVNIIHKMPETFNFIHIYTKNKDESLYKFLEASVPQDHLKIYNGLDNLNAMNLDKGFPDAQGLVIFDDLVLERDQDAIEQMMIRGRKLANLKGISIIYLSQSFYQIPKIIRKQATHIILKKLNGKRDITLILNEMALGIDSEELKKIFKYCTDGNFLSFLYIDLEAPEDQRFRKGFSEIISETQGGEISKDELQQVVKNGYTGKKDAINDFEKDKSLSGKRVQVYHNKTSGETIVNHAGTRSGTDIFNDIMYSMGLLNKTKRAKHSKKIQKQAEEKYDVNNMISTSHSLGAPLLRSTNTKSRQVHVNPAINLTDAKKKNKKNETIIRSQYDVVSSLLPKKKAETVKVSNPLNVLKNHRSSNTINKSKKKTF